MSISIKRWRSFGKRRSMPLHISLICTSALRDNSFLTILDHLFTFILERVEKAQNLQVYTRHYSQSQSYQTLIPSLLCCSAFRASSTKREYFWLMRRLRVPKTGYHHHQETRQSVISRETPFIGKCSSAHIVDRAGQKMGS